MTKNLSTHTHLQGGGLLSTEKKVTRELIRVPFPCPVLLPVDGKYGSLMFKINTTLRRAKCSRKTILDYFIEKPHHLKFNTKPKVNKKTT